METFEKIWDEANEKAKIKAFENAGTDIMIYPCGFAWVNVKPVNCDFAKWLVENKHASKDIFYGGVSIWVGDYNQSMLHKYEHAKELEKQFNAVGFNTTAMSRLD
jgi:hypothetical protein